jgi:hypothetical protein
MKITTAEISKYKGWHFMCNDFYADPSPSCNRASSCKSIVAILSLELTGIPELSENRDFPWPKPAFVTSTRSHMFEVSIESQIS